jgi:hypothetical protein
MSDETTAHPRDNPPTLAPWDVMNYRARALELAHHCTGSDADGPEAQCGRPRRGLRRLPVRRPPPWSSTSRTAPVLPHGGFACRPPAREAARAARQVQGYVGRKKLSPRLPATAIDPVVDYVIDRAAGFRLT